MYSPPRLQALVHTGRLKAASLSASASAATGEQQTSTPPPGAPRLLPLAHAPLISPDDSDVSDDTELDDDTSTSGDDIFDEDDKDEEEVSPVKSPSSATSLRSALRTPFSESNSGRRLSSLRVRFDDSLNSIHTFEYVIGPKFERDN